MLQANYSELKAIKYRLSKHPTRTKYSSRKKVIIKVGTKRKSSQGLVLKDIYRAR